jgi:hypothetical protein
VSSGIRSDVFDQIESETESIPPGNPKMGE